MPSFLSIHFTNTSSPWFSIHLQTSCRMYDGTPMLLIPLGSVSHYQPRIVQAGLSNAPGLPATARPNPRPSHVPPRQWPCPPLRPPCRSFSHLMTNSSNYWNIIFWWIFTCFQNECRKIRSQIRFPLAATFFVSFSMPLASILETFFTLRFRVHFGNFLAGAFIFVTCPALS